MCDNCDEKKMSHPGPAALQGGPAVPARVSACMPITRAHWPALEGLVALLRLPISFHLLACIVCRAFLF